MKIELNSTVETRNNLYDDLKLVSYYTISGLVLCIILIIIDVLNIYIYKTYHGGFYSTVSETGKHAIEMYDM